MKSVLRGKIKNVVAGLTVAVFGLGIAPGAMLPVAAAGSATFTITPGSGTYTVGDTLTVKIYENSAEPVIGVTANISYDKNSLEFVSLDGGQSGFTTSMPSSAGNGVVKISRAIMGGSLSGSQLVSAVTFKAVGASGRSVISFLPGSAIVASGGRDVWNGSTAGAAFTVKAPVTGGGSTPAPAPTPAPSGGSSGGSSSSGTASSPSGPSGGSSSSGSSGSSGGATGGPAPSQPSSSVQTAPATSVETTELLAPSTFFVAVQILDGEGNIVPGAVVTLDDGQKVKTDSKGIASFMNVTSGEHTVTVDHDGKKRSEKIAVQQTGNEAAMPQQFKLKLSSADQVAKPFWIIYAALAIIVLGTAGVLFPRRPHFATSDIDAVAPQDIVISDANSHPSLSSKPKLEQPGTVITPTVEQQPPKDEQKP